MAIIRAAIFDLVGKTMVFPEETYEGKIPFFGTTVLENFYKWAIN